MKIYQYFVEGETEKKLINTLKTELQCIQAGKVEVFNVVQERLTPLRLMRLKRNTVVVLVFDTDKEDIRILTTNLTFLKEQPNIGQVICITQVENLEDELKRSCQIREIKELTGSRTNTEFKEDMIRQGNFAKKLKEYSFDISKLWAKTSEKSVYRFIENEAEKLKI